MRPLLCLAACVLFAACSVAGAQQPAAELPANPKPLITVSKETTRITGPLRDDGYVDYVAALNEQFGRGVTPENNAAVPLWQALGPEPVDEEIRAEFFRLLGIPQPPRQGRYLVDFNNVVERLGPKAGEDPDGQFDRAMKGPWSAEDCPAVAGWLQANEAALPLVVEASRRPRYYAPMVSHDDVAPMISVLLPTLGQARNVARAVMARAMLRLDSGDVDAAADDLLACHRFARLIGQGPTLIDALVAIAIDTMACQGDTVLATSGKLSAEQAAAYLAELKKLPPLPSMVDKIDVAERYMFLDAAAGIARNGPSALSGIAGDGGGGGFSAAVLKAISDSMLDWDEVLRIGNAWYDRMVEAGRQPTREARNAAWTKVDDDLHELTERAADKQALLADLLSGKSPRQLMTEKMGAIMIALLLPAVNAAMDAEERGKMRFEVTELAVALSAYHAEHGAYPKKLGKLAPTYVAEIPRDRFADADLTYRPRKDGYLLYSVGRNATDDGGRNWHFDPHPDDALPEDWDDIAVRK